MGKSYDNLLMIYYSGTGNSKRVSEWLGELAEGKGMKSHTCSYNQFDPKMIADFKGKTLIGFFSATHGFNMPHSMLGFLISFNVLKGSDVFIGNTRAGMKLWKAFLPGLSGVAMYFPALIMLIKGYRIKAMYPVDLPSNWISLHPGIRGKVVESIVARCKRLTLWFGNEVFEGKPVFLKSFILLPLDLLVAPLAIGYYFLGRFMIAKTFVANYNCNNCGSCISQCPTHSIVMRGNRPFWKFSCESCMHCMNYCPKRAIETAHSFIFIILALFILLLNPLLASIATYLVRSMAGDSLLLFKLLYYSFQWSMMFAVFALGYQLVHYLMRFSWFNRIITYTSFTSWAFWRRYRIPAK